MQCHENDSVVISKVVRIGYESNLLEEFIEARELSS